MALYANGVQVTTGGNVDATKLTGNLPAISGASLTGISVTPTTSQVASATASISAGAVGSYAALGNYYNSDAKNIGDTNSGSNMFPVNFNGGNQSSARSGTWRCMGYSAGGDFSTRQTIWLRIS